MKKTFTLFLSAILISCFSNSKAAITHITVGNFQFSPSSLTISLGDTIIYTWLDGSHTTTSVGIPNGAVAWNESMNSNSPEFMYVPAVEGTYNYVCLPHQSMGMTGQFTVINTSGISENLISGASLNGVMIGGDQLQVKFNIPSPATVSIRLYNLIGNTVSTFMENVRESAGVYEEKFLLPSLRSGIYMLQLQTPEGVLTKRVLIP